MSSPRDLGSFNAIVEDNTLEIIGLLNAYDQSSLAKTSTGFHHLVKQNHFTNSRNQLLKKFGQHLSQDIYSSLSRQDLASLKLFLENESSPLHQYHFISWCLSQEKNFPNNFTFWSFALKKILHDLGLEASDCEVVIQTQSELQEAIKIVRCVGYFREKIEFQNGFDYFEINNELSALELEAGGSSLRKLVVNKLFALFFMKIIDSAIYDGSIVCTLKVDLTQNEFYWRNSTKLIQQFDLDSADIFENSDNVESIFKAWLRHSLKMKQALQLFKEIKKTSNISWILQINSEAAPNAYLRLAMITPILSQCFTTQDNLQLLFHSLELLPDSVTASDAYNNINQLKNLLEQSSIALNSPHGVILFTHLLNHTCDFNINSANYIRYIASINRHRSDTLSELYSIIKFTRNVAPDCYIDFVNALLQRPFEYESLWNAILNLQNINALAVRHIVLFLTDTEQLDSLSLTTAYAIQDASFDHSNLGILKKLFLLKQQNGKPWLAQTEYKALVNCLPRAEPNLNLIKILISYPAAISRIEILKDNYPDYFKILIKTLTKLNPPPNVESFLVILQAPDELFNIAKLDSQIRKLPTWDLLKKMSDNVRKSNYLYTLLPMHSFILKLNSMKTIPANFYTLIEFYHLIAKTGNESNISIFMRIVEKMTETTSNPFLITKLIDQKSVLSHKNPHIVYNCLGAILDDIKQEEQPPTKRQATNENTFFKAKSLNVAQVITPPSSRR